jgi:hypothetical protein
LEEAFDEEWEDEREVAQHFGELTTLFGGQKLSPGNTFGVSAA